uniref:Integrase, catalytic region, zinc finger, CCHC-type, peptidase aspartic, catalytic n=1 Tax=Tanacetum cinerariifolium TaxID=118510 RepID=A0A6L2NF86_TANCI|nr:integrase, catalytic region, zinc finger, CCHC-type, peptidase aspartic, catalytic [Tanacetum cinerariifolium]
MGLTYLTIDEGPFQIGMFRETLAECEEENGVYILKSVDEGPFQMGMFKETLVKCEDGAFHLGPERPRVYSDLSPEEKDKYNADSRATNILLQGSLKDIYTLINHYTDAKDIWDNVKCSLKTMLMENLSSAYPVYGKAGLSYDSDILSEYVKDNAVPVVQSSVSSIQNDPYMMILNDMHEQPTQHESVTAQNNVVDNSLSAKRATSKEQVELLIILLHSGLINPLHSGSINPLHRDKMDDENVLAPAPTRFDDQILPFVAWVFIGKSNFVLDLHKSCHLGRIHNIHQRSASPFHLTKEDFRLGNLKLIPKGKIDEVFIMPILDELISNNIRNALYYNAYLEMVAKHDQKVVAKKYKKKKTRPPKLKPAKEKSTKTTPPQKASKGKITKVRKVKSPFQLVDEPDKEPAQCEPEPELEHKSEGDKNDMELAIQMSLESFQA